MPFGKDYSAKDLAAKAMGKAPSPAADSKKSGGGEMSEGALFMKRMFKAMQEGDFEAAFKAAKYVKDM
jgi:hypothetical protein